MSAAVEVENVLADVRLRYPCADVVAEHLEEMNAEPERQTDGSYMARCVHPDHRDNGPSMQVRDGDEAAVRLFCYGACSTESMSRDEKRAWVGEVFTAIDAGEWLPEPEHNGRTRKRRSGWASGAALERRGSLVETYQYVDRHGEIRRTRQRFEPKEFRWFPPQGDLAGLPLYRLPELLEADAAEPVWLTEGEKDCDNLREQCGVAAVCSASGGVQNVEDFRGRDVVIVIDWDDAGRKKGSAWLGALTGVARSVRAVRPALEADRADVSDHLAAGHALDDLIPWAPDGQAKEATAGDLHEEAESKSATEAPAAPGASWGPIDLTEFVSGDYEEPQGTLMLRDDGVGLIYAGVVHSFHGESESGKSLVLQYECARQMAAGNDVVYLDFEDTPSRVAGRLLEMGVSKDAILRRLDYRQPQEPPTGDVYSDLLRRRPALVVVDGVTEAMLALGYSEEDWNTNATKFTGWAKRVARRTGAAVVVIDHTPKPKGDGGSRFAIGGQMKMAGLDGAAYVVEVKKPPPMRGAVGLIHLRVGKDRPGGVRYKCADFRASDRTQLAAEVEVDSTGPVMALRFRSPVDAATKPFRPTDTMQAVSDFLTKYPVGGGPGASQKVLAEQVAHRKETVIEAVKILEREGYVKQEPGARGALMHWLIKPYSPTVEDVLGTCSPNVGNRSDEITSSESTETRSRPVPPLGGGEQGTGHTVGLPPVPGTSGNRWEQVKESGQSKESEDPESPGSSFPTQASEETARVLDIPISPCLECGLPCISDVCSDCRRDAEKRARHA